MIQKHSFLMISLIFIGLLPLSAQGTEKKSIQASDILEAINKKQNINVSNHIIIGDMDFFSIANKVFEKKDDKYEYNRIIIDSEIIFDNCIFKGKISTWKIVDKKYWYKGIFKEKIKFNKCIFEDRVDFSFAGIEKRISFINSDFLAFAVFGVTKFSDVVHFNNVKFQDIAYFQDANFDRYGLFEYCTFNKDGIFAKAYFKSSLFKFIEFLGSAVFQDTVFDLQNDFEAVNFKNKLTFKGASFSGLTKFKHTIWQGEEYDPTK